jgi:hypothetical protein
VGHGNLGRVDKDGGWWRVSQRCRLGSRLAALTRFLLRRCGALRTNALRNMLTREFCNQTIDKLRNR